jgi:hypothetical protein
MRPEPRPDRLSVMRWLVARGRDDWICRKISRRFLNNGGWQCRSVREIVWMRARFGLRAPELYFMTPDLSLMCAVPCELLTRACARHATSFELRRMWKFSYEHRSKQALQKVQAAREKRSRSMCLIC